jgi:release factor glutamine methyltransferase
MTTRIDIWLQKAITSLASISENPALEAQLLAAHITCRPRSWVIAHPEVTFSHEQYTGLESLLDLLISGWPLPYLLGHWEFFGLDFILSPDVLIPRPETEILVSAALDWLIHNPCRRLAADVGTGSACIAVSLAKKIHDLKVVATDLSSPALHIAMRNISRYGLNTHIFPVQTSLLSACPGPFDLLCANLPYIPSQTLLDLPVSAHEPILALDGGLDGLDIIRRLLLESHHNISSAGLILLEIESGQSIAASNLVNQYFPSARIKLIHDLTDRPRILSIHL